MVFFIPCTVPALFKKRAYALYSVFVLRSQDYSSRTIFCYRYKKPTKNFQKIFHAFFESNFSYSLVCFFKNYEKRYDKTRRKPLGNINRISPQNVFALNA